MKSKLNYQNYLHGGILGNFHFLFVYIVAYDFCYNKYTIFFLGKSHLIQMCSREVNMVARGTGSEPGHLLFH